MSTHRVYFGRGAQTLYTIPHRNGRAVRVSAATYSIQDLFYGYTSAEHTLVSSTAATLDTVSTTLAAKAGSAAADRRVMTVPSTTGIVAGHSYWLEAATGHAEPVKIASVMSATALLTASEIVGNYAANSTLKGLEVAATFPLATANDEDSLLRLRCPWLITWVFTGLDAPARESIHIERAEEVQLATLADLQELDPMISRVGGDRIDLSSALSQAHRDFRTDLMKAGASEADYLAGNLGKEAVKHKACLHALKHSTEQSAEKRAEYCERRYTEILASLLVGRAKPEVVALDQHDETPHVSPAALFLAC
jgi:hypothetical protein